MSPLPLTTTLPFPRSRSRGESPPATAVAPPVPPGRLLRVSRMLAVAVQLEELLQRGVVTDYAALARLGEVTRARITQIMNLLLLAPDIQAELLHWPRITTRRDPFCLRHLQPLTRIPDWTEQRIHWHQLKQSLPS